MRSATIARDRIFSAAFAVAMLVGAGAWATACGGADANIAAPCDPLTDPSCTSDDGSVPDGVIVLGDGAWLYPDGLVTPPGGGDGAPIPPDGPGCRVIDTACTTAAECCSTLCTGGKCASSSFCRELGDACTSGGDCCGGICTSGNRDLCLIRVRATLTPRPSPRRRGEKRRRRP